MLSLEAELVSRNVDNRFHSFDISVRPCLEI
jgi:hypothetical protein